jgi:uncharacterized protein YjiS (DUF1127 family)
MPAVMISSPAAVRPTSCATSRAASGPRPRLSRLSMWLQRIRTRRALAALHPDQARDAGLEPWDLRAEIRKPFWRA